MLYIMFRVFMPCHWVTVMDVSDLNSINNHCVRKKNFERRRDRCSRMRDLFIMTVMSVELRSYLVKVVTLCIFLCILSILSFSNGKCNYHNNNNNIIVDQNILLFWTRHVNCIHIKVFSQSVNETIIYRDNQ